MFVIDEDDTWDRKLSKLKSGSLCEQDLQGYANTKVSSIDADRGVPFSESSVMEIHITEVGHACLSECESLSRVVFGESSSLK